MGKVRLRSGRIMRCEYFSAQRNKNAKGSAENISAITSFSPLRETPG